MDCVSDILLKEGEDEERRVPEQHILLAVSAILFDINLPMVGWSVPQTENILMDGKLGSEVGKEKND